VYKNFKICTLEKVEYKNKTDINLESIKVKLLFYSFYHYDTKGFLFLRPVFKTVITPPIVEIDLWAGFVKSTVAEKQFFSCMT
jgi:hypothetical protein